MTKDEYLKLYGEWTSTNDRQKTNEIVETITNGVIKELEKLEEVYNKCGMYWKSPIHQQCDCLFDLRHVDRIRLEAINTCDVKIGLHEHYGNGTGKWHNVTMNVKWLGDEGRYNLVHNLIEEAIQECDDTILEEQDAIKSAEENMHDAQKKKDELLKKLDELGKSPVGKELK